jgi:protein-S-isoprenylcysteine O-methyltransferase Ste14
MFAWCTPKLSVGHLLFAGVWTAYILVAIQLEERNLAEFHAEYSDYKKRTGMLLPKFGSSSAEGTVSEKSAVSETLSA